jgi:hypothetical protein
MFGGVPKTIFSMSYVVHSRTGIFGINPSPGRIAEQHDSRGGGFRKERA